MAITTTLSHRYNPSMSRIVAAIFSLIIPVVASATVIDTAPVEDYFGPGSVDYSPLGGVFTVPGDSQLGLDSFTIEYRDFLPTNNFRAVVMGILLDEPDTVLWQSDETPYSTPMTPVVFSPGITLNPGEQYLIGVDFGGLTSITSAETNAFGVSGYDQPPYVLHFGYWWGAWNSAHYNLASTVSLSEIPEPSTSGLATAIAVLGIAFCRRRRQGNL